MLNLPVPHLPADGRQGGRRGALHLRPPVALQQHRLGRHLLAAVVVQVGLEVVVRLRRHTAHGTSGSGEGEGVGIAAAGVAVVGAVFLLVLNSAPDDIHTVPHQLLRVEARVDACRGRGGSWVVS